MNKKNRKKELLIENSKSIYLYSDYIFEILSKYVITKEDYDVLSKFINLLIKKHNDKWMIENDFYS